MAMTVHKRMMTLSISYKAQKDFKPGNLEREETYIAIPPPPTRTPASTLASTSSVIFPYNGLQNDMSAQT